LASTAFPLYGIPILGEGVDEKEKNPFDKGSIKKADVILYVVYSPEERYLLIKSIKGKVKLRDSSGYQRFLNEGEKLYKKWTPSTPPSELKDVDIIVGM
jgi:shikimate 5-dehydrogenase